MNVISLFSGCGGFDLGITGGFSYLDKQFNKTGHKIIFAVDNDKNACATYAANIGKHIVCSKIEDIKAFPKADMVIGGYPCQGFSIIGTRLLADKRNLLFLEYARCLDQVKPKIFIAENVKGLLSMGGGKIIEAMIKEFEKKGYTVRYKLLNSKNFGIPQERERVFIVGIRKGLRFNFEFPPITHLDENDNKQLSLFKNYEKCISLKEALSDLAHPPSDEIYSAGFSPLYMSRNRRRGWDEVSFTIQAGSMHVPLHPSSPEMIQINKDKWEFGNPETSRRFTFRECLRIQSFPNSFKLEGKGFATKYRQVGNAVPPVLAWHLGNRIPKTID